MQVLHLTEHGFYNLHIGVHDWQVILVRWLFMPFLLGFYSPYNQKNVTSKSRSFVYYKKKLTQLSTT